MPSTVTPGEAFEEVVARAELKRAHLLEDKGYDTDAIHAKLKVAGIRHVIPPRSTRKVVIH